MDTKESYSELPPQSKFFFSPEDAIIFNSSRLLLLFETLNQLNPKQSVDLDRLSYYDFFSANPFLIIDKKNPIYIELEMEGFRPNKLEYVGTKQRFRTKRLSIKQYISLLLSRGLVRIENKDGRLLFKITDLGTETASKFCSPYADAYRKSAMYVVKFLRSYSDTKLTEDAATWLDCKPIEFDLIDMVEDDE